MVKDLPYPYTSKAQYERSLQTPIGTEWNTRLGFQRGTLPRVVKKVRYPSLSFEFALLITVLSPVLLLNLWSRCRRVFPRRLWDSRLVSLATGSMCISISILLNARVAYVTKYG